MGKISCSIAKDLLPLYVDGVLSEEAARAVNAHLETCENCRKEYEVMTQSFVLPSAPNVQEENGKVLKGLKRHLKIKKLITAAIAAVITAILVLSACLIYMHVGAVQDHFTQNTMVTVRDIQTDGNWVQLEIGKSGYLNFDHMFCQKEITVDANSDSAVALRISDTEGNVVIDGLTVQPGTSASLKELKNKIDYKVEIQTHADFILIRFY